MNYYKHIKTIIIYWLSLPAGMFDTAIYILSAGYVVSAFQNVVCFGVKNTNKIVDKLENPAYPFLYVVLLGSCRFIDDFIKFLSFTAVSPDLFMWSVENTNWYLEKRR